MATYGCSVSDNMKLIFSRGMSATSDNILPQEGSRNEIVERVLFTGVNCGINFDKYEKIPVLATGSDVPFPCAVFDELQLHPWIQENIKKSGYTKPTPVQKYSIPSLLNCRDLMSCAQTGSGKTAAFLIPVINHIIQNEPTAMKMSHMNRRTVFPVALILLPTRELAMQTHKEALKFAYRTNVLSAVLYGGRENYRDQVQKLMLGCHMLIATPGRLLDLMNQNVVSLHECRFLILDEADRMLDMGFEPQIRQIVEYHSMPEKGKRVTALFSATFPKEIQVLAQDFLVPNYVFLSVGRVGSTSENIVQKVIWVEEHDKKRLLMELLDTDVNKGLTLIFVETKRGANELAWHLQRNHYNVMPIHGDLKQYERERHLEMFRSGQTNILVATAVAARGLDIPNVNHVINFNLPTDIDEYVHRIGRTGRAGNIGLATSFFTDRNRNISHDLMDLLVESNQEVPEWLEKMTKENYKSPSKSYDRARPISVAQNRVEELNSSAWCSQTPSTIHASFSHGDTGNAFINEASTIFQSNMYQIPQSNCIYQPHGNTFSFVPFAPISSINYWRSTANTSQSVGFLQPDASAYGEPFGVQTSQTAFCNWHL
ncbi:ATP-dependent RNA helicase An3, putative [Brugia malayi]|uniref:RNA helicase n=3 Tax=Brugia malayi TaxID=6279 RepID=A0A0J9XLN3_BRUMA|nr:ATP-dependent RNA helicase An3, putative [Brugia malayi]CDP91055.1 Bm6413, isoform b [Brugia malayi]VIO88339.1 ATP-dependent RNA helicase An3, putative [Brugia malayi]